jgi:hypothetical protein
MVVKQEGIVRLLIASDGLVRLTINHINHHAVAGCDWPSAPWTDIWPDFDIFITHEVFNPTHANHDGC